MIDIFKNNFEFLSNFYLHEICYDGIFYPSNEHAYQASKSQNYSERIEISKIDSPGQAKKAGKKVKLRPDWEEAKVYIMWDLVKKKFEDKELKKKLLDTKDEELIEGNHWGDCFWGICNGKGENYLGRILMHVRKELKQGFEFSGLQPNLPIK